MGFSNSAKRKGRSLDREKTGKRIGEGFGDEVFPLPSKDMVMRFFHIPQICGSLDRELEKDLVMRFFLFPPRIW